MYFSFPGLLPINGLGNGRAAVFLIESLERHVRVIAEATEVSLSIDAEEALASDRKELFDLERVAYNLA